MGAVLIDCVVSYHVAPLTCGTAKWNVRLAEHLGVPCLAWTEAWESYTHPLFSLKPDEIRVEDARTLYDRLQRYVWRGASSEQLDPARVGGYDLICHAVPGPAWNHLTWWASRLYAVNPIVQYHLSRYRGDVRTIHCPSSLTGNPDRGSYRILTYGMAHKLTTPYYVQLKALLEHAHPDYTVSLSTAVHEGSPWDESLQRSAACLRAIFGDRLRVLGYLADDALAKELHDCDAVALFYDPALRSNNTTAWAALDAGKPLVTNLDDDSPPALAHRVMHLPALQHWPFRHVLADYGREGQQVAQAMSWDKLVETLRA